VTPVARSRGMFEVFDGGRRWRALNLLVTRGVIDPDQYDVPVRVLKGDDAELTETSLAVSFHHMKLSPAEECRAFQHFLAGNSDIDAVARRFGVTRRFIDGRLRLADLAEPIFAKLASGDLTLDMAKAYASTSSHETQLRIWATYGSYSNYSADSIRRIIANDMMRANDPIALLVGTEAYEAAGGIVDRDFFSDVGDRWMQPDLARSLAATIMDAEAARIGTERGLGWIMPIATHHTWDAARDFHKVTLPEQPMSLEEAERAEQIEQRMAGLHDEMQNEELTDEAFTAMETEMDTLAAELAALENRPVFLPPELAPRVGAFLTLAQNGTMVLHETYYSQKPIRVTVIEPAPADGDAAGGKTGEAGDLDGSDQGDDAGKPTTTAPTFRIEEELTTGAAGSAGKPVDPDNAAPGGKALSQVLSDQLAMQRRDVLGAALIANPTLALDYMLFAMVDERCGTAANDGTTIRADLPQDPVSITNMPKSRARDYLNEVHEGLEMSWQESDHQVVRFEAFRALGDEVKAAWLAYIVATSLEAKISYGTNAQNPMHGRMASILDIDVASWWRPTSENFFDRVSKGSLISLLHEVGGPALSSRHATEKKPIISANCQKLFGGDAIVEPAIKEAALKWLPTPMCFTDKVIATEALGDDGQDDLADLIGGDDEGDEGGDGMADDDAGPDDLAALIGDGPDEGSVVDPAAPIGDGAIGDGPDGDISDVQQAEDNVTVDPQHGNDDEIEPEAIAAE
jgi:ParB family chromosome partitioning protein